MDLKNRTKLAFAQELETMLIDTPMDKIRIVTLCQRCHTIPQTFYYHFHDKYELVAWLFLYDFSKTYGQKGLKYSVDSIVDNLNQMNKRRIFYQKTYTQRAQNSIDQYIQAFNMKIATKAVTEYFGYPITCTQKLAIMYHSYGMMGLFKEWLTDQLPVTIEQLAEFQYQHTPEFLKHAFEHDDFTAFQ